MHVDFDYQEQLRFGRKQNDEEKNRERKENQRQRGRNGKVENSDEVSGNQSAACAQFTIFGSSIEAHGRKIFSAFHSIWKFVGISCNLKKMDVQ